MSEQPIAAIVLAAGRGTRMGGANKLTRPFDGAPLLRHSVQAVLASSLRPVLVVTGHQENEVQAALAGLDVTFVSNPHHARGMGTSIDAGIAALPAVAGAAIVLGDMPLVSGALLDTMAQALRPSGGTRIVVPIRNGRRGNPVIWGHRFFAELRALQGDVGARGLIAAHPDAVVEVEAPDDGIFADVDTHDELERLELHRMAERFEGDPSAALDGMRAEDA